MSGTEENYVEGLTLRRAMTDWSSGAMPPLKLESVLSFPALI